MDQINDCKPMSQKAYARHRGVYPMAVSRAIKSGRLKASIVNGQIIDAELADKEWAANTSADHRERAMGAAAAPAPATPAAAQQATPLQADPENPTALPGMTKSEADTVNAIWKARHTELEFKQAAGELLPARDVAHKMADVFTACRTKLMALPSRARQDLPHLSVADIGVIESLVREALEDLAASAVLPESGE